MSHPAHHRLALVFLSAAAAVLGVSVETAHASPGDGADPAQSVSTKLESVSASSATDAWAVGFRTAPGGKTAALTRHWDGERWTVVPSVLPAEYSFLWGVADISPTDAWAVGEGIGSAQVLPFAEHWDGHAWAEVDIANRPGLGKLTAVSAVGPDDVWMIGTREDRNPFQYDAPFIAHWDGHHLRTVHPASYPRARTTDLTSVSAAAADDVWAVGAHGRHGDVRAPLVEHFDGTSWSTVPGDPAQGDVGNLAGVAADSSADAWSVGWYVAPGDTTISAYAQHWDGSVWTQSPVPSPGYAANLTSVDIVAPDDVWAVGVWEKAIQQATSRPLLEHWDGSTWTVVSGPNQAHTATTVQSVSMVAPDAGFAVGASTANSRSFAYAIRWNGNDWTR